MGKKLRVFISSTMENLVNERDLVCRKLEEFNFEPVSAEEMYPNNGTSWQRVSSEVADSDVFVLLIGESYGWVPPEGEMCEHDKSVTHLEYDKAHELDIPVLVFIKRLDEKAGRDNSEQANRRREFTSQVQHWKDGRFRMSFDKAFDLADKVGAALVNFLTEAYLKGPYLSLIPKSEITTPNDLSHKTTVPGLSALPIKLIHSVVDGDAVLFVGAGMSLDFGFPSAMVFAQLLKNKIKEELGEAHYACLAGADFFGVATDVQAKLGRPVLEQLVVEALRLPAKEKSSVAHDFAIDLFNIILTTNFDMLLEKSVEDKKENVDFISGEITSTLPERCVVKLHGCVGQPDSLLLTESQVYNFDTAKPNLWNSVVKLLSSKKIIVVGSSIRDPSIIRLFSKAAGKLSGYYVSPVKDELIERRMQQWGLQCIEASAEQFMKRLSEDVKATKERFAK